MEIYMKETQRKMLYHEILETHEIYLTDVIIKIVTASFTV